MAKSKASAAAASVAAVDEQRPAHLFKPGQSGNPAGRPKGSRNKLAEDFIGDMYAAWQDHGPSAIKSMIASDPGAFVKVVAGLLPREVKIETTSDLSDDQLDQRIQRLADALGLEIGTVRTPGRTATAPGSKSTH